ncbi:TRAP transporter substrate-binding protein [Sinorhizobium meliloti]|jgi:tripartite ATP-independent transporter DctP family solute receptor|uniref:TRAP transporter substrate-binding protein n=1 Tax=Sinorhizobium TaxID=28105 RepID=UPI000C9A9C27|nr:MULTISPECIES: TRAP transporter substrate-binding protein [Sinorhizobium]PND27409.1 C4-dicarboxylate ABC transporter substrate-binding protein [Sinorhizobium sp. M4_45]RVQ05049.1 DctP family TRAP transporter solute-binding subunit [Sinorhizobium meliloti]
MFRRLLCAAALATTLALPAAAETVIKAGHGTTTGHPTHFALVRFAELVSEKTNGEVKVEVYPDRQLGEEREMVEGLQFGSVDMAVVSTGPLLAFAPEIGIVDLPFLFRDSPHVYATLDGDVGKDLLGKFDTRGIHGLAWWENGWRHLTAKKEISKPEDLTGLKLRTMQNPVHMAAFEKLGASPVPMVWGEVFTSLGQGVIDAQENPITVIYVNSLWEVQSHLMLTGHVYGPHVALFSKMKWDSLTPEQQAAVSEAAAEATGFQREKAAELEKDYLAKLKEKGMTVVEIDTTSFRDALRDLAASQQNIDPALLEKIQSVQ